MNFARLQTEPEASTLAAGGHNSRRNPWQPQATTKSFKTKGKIKRNLRIF
jgi:hypothetical protein